MAWKSKTSTWTTTTKQNWTLPPPYFTPQLSNIHLQLFSAPLLFWLQDTSILSTSCTYEPKSPQIQAQTSEQDLHSTMADQEELQASDNAKKLNKMPWRKTTSSAHYTHLQKKTQVIIESKNIISKVSLLSFIKES